MNTDDNADDKEFFEPDEIAEIALEYREEMLRSLGVVGVEHSASYSAPGEVIRRYPVEATGAHDAVEDTIGSHRVLTDTSDYSGESDVARHEDICFITICETTGYAAIQSSATLALGWSTIPTPREIRLAEHVNYPALLAPSALRRSVTP